MNASEKPRRQHAAEVIRKFPARRGALVLVTSGGKRKTFVVGWKPDSRRRHVLGISAHRNRVDALVRASALGANDMPAPSRRHRSDPQRNRVYLWEQKALASNPAYRSVAETRADAAWVLGNFGIDPVDIGIDRTCADCSHFSSRHGIRLSPDMLDRLTLLHELSHHICHLMNVDESSHGPVFVGVFSALIAFCDGAPLNAVLSRAASYGLEFNDAVAIGFTARGRHGLAA